jgi:hypothetical protein
MNDFLYEKELSKQLEKDRWLRHLFNKLGKEIICCVESGEHLRGILKTIQFTRGVINLEVQSSDRVWFINWKHITYIEAKSEG